MARKISIKKKEKAKAIFSLKISSKNNKYNVDYVLDADNEDMYFILQEFCRQTTMLLVSRKIFSKSGNKKVHRKKSK